MRINVRTENEMYGQVNDELTIYTIPYPLRPVYFGSRAQRRLSATKAMQKKRRLHGQVNKLFGFAGIAMWGAA